MPDLLIGYTFDQRVHAYRNLATGRLVARARILELLDAQLTQRGNRLARLTLDFASNQMDARHWLAVMKDELRRAAIENLALGSGGWEKISQAGYGRVGGILQADLRRLIAFADDIVSEKLSEAQILNRLGMYLGNARRNFWDAERDALRLMADRYRERRVLGIAEHCFPAGTMILTPTGETPIEDISEGDQVQTQFGSREVTRTYSREYSGDFVSIVCGQSTVTCTSNHPFLTTRGWIAAGNLLPDDSVVLFENGPQHIDRQVRFPYTHYDITASSQVGILSRVTPALFDLPISQWFKSRMPMPPVTIGLNNKTAKPKVNDELGLNKDLRFIDDVKIIKHGGKVAFQPRRFVAPHFSIALKKFSNVLRFVHVTPKILNSLWAFRRVVLSNVSRSRAMNYSGIHVMIKYYAEPIGVILNIGTTSIRQQLKTRIGASGRKILTNNGVFIGGPTQSGRVVLDAIRLLAITAGSTLWTDLPSESFLAQLRCSTVLTNSIISVLSMAAKGACFLLRFTFGLQDFNSGFAYTNPRTIAPQFIGRGFPVLENHSAYFTGSVDHSRIVHVLPPDNDPQSLYSHFTKNAKVVVYNLEVAEAHHYVANGFVVHNCDDCVAYARLGWQSFGVLPVPGTRSQCLTNCRCTLERQLIRAKQGQLSEQSGAEVVLFNPYHEPADHET